MPGPRPASVLPWALCGLTLLLFLIAGLLRLTADAPLAPGGIGSPFVYLGSAGFLGVAVVGALIADRAPANAFGWLWCVLGLVLGVLALTTALRQAGVLTGSIGPALSGAAIFTVLGLTVLCPLLFPDGRLPSAGWRWLPWTTAVLVLATVVVEVADPRPDPPADGAALRWTDVGVAAVSCLLLASFASLVGRYRRAGDVRRAQVKWFLWATCLYCATVVPDLVDVRLGNGPWPYLNSLAAGLLPVAVGFAVLRHRLFDIDRVISRTVAYGLLSGALLILYGLLVAVLPALDPLTGDSELAVVGWTLVLAGAFGAARRRVQAVVDRRFDRARYDARRSVEQYAARLRTQVDLHEVAAGLRDTVSATVGPERVGVWLRDAPGRRG